VVNVDENEGVIRLSHQGESKEDYEKSSDARINTRWIGFSKDDEK
jgi:hypothetical protein